MTDVPISDALIDSAQFQIQSVAPATPGSGLVRLFRGPEGWAEKRQTGEVNLVSELGIRKTVTHFSNSALLELHNTPISLVFSQGVGKIVFPLFLVFDFLGGTTPYTISDVSRLWFGYGSGTNEPHDNSYFGLETDVFLSGTQRVITTFILGRDSTGQLTVTDTTMLNKPLCCQLDTTLPITDGDGSMNISTFWTAL